MTNAIKFGTDGWRAIIAKDYTFENVSRLAFAVCEVMQRLEPERTKMIVGYDRRFLSKEFAETVCAVYAERGYDVLFCSSFMPTPVLSWAAKNEDDVAGSTVITSSHNPPQWNGFKFKEKFGGSALPSTTRLFEEKAQELLKEQIYFLPPDGSFEEHLESGKIQYFDPFSRYTESLLRQVDVKAMRAFQKPLALDVMHGSGSGYLKRILESHGIAVREIHHEDNPGFNGIAPEPIGKNLRELASLVRSESFACGLALDGDADRLGAIDENGDPFTTQMILSTVYWHMVHQRKKPWSISRSVSTTRMVDLIAEKDKQKCIETPVGFKFIAEQMIAGNAQIGGEESGGVGILDHIPERDGLMTALLLLEIQASMGMGLRQVYETICKNYRPYYFTRLDLHLSSDQMRSALDRLQNETPERWGNKRVERIETMDGFKFYLEDGAWLLIRPSGTEPIFRTYAEAESEIVSQEMVGLAKQWIQK